MRFLTLTVLLSLSFTTLSLAQLPSLDAQIESAVQPLPEGMRAEATVLGYDGSDQLSTIRDGTNGMICLADDPSDDQFHVACYHDSLEPFMARGRELRALGHDSDEVEEMRRKEISSGEIPMPERAALYSLTGDASSWDPESGEISDVRGLHVLYIPYATLEETGLPPRAPRGHPWLMDPGEPWAHIMLALPRE